MRLFYHSRLTEAFVSLSRFCILPNALQQRTPKSGNQGFVRHVFGLYTFAEMDSRRMKGELSTARRVIHRPQKINRRLSARLRTVFGFEHDFKGNSTAGSYRPFATLLCFCAQSRKLAVTLVRKLTRRSALTLTGPGRPDPRSLKASISVSQSGSPPALPRLSRN